MTRTTSSSNNSWDGATGFRSSVGAVVRAIVVDALTLGVGRVLPTGADYQERFGAGAGTVQRALGVLGEQGAVVVQARGHLGRTISSIDVGRAWQAAGLSAVRLVFPPGGSAEIDVLAATISAQLAERNIPHNERHVRGASLRLDSVLRGDDDVAVLSAGAASESPYVSHATTTRYLSAGTYYAKGRLVVLRRAADAACKEVKIVGLDADSFDHHALTEAEFPASLGFTQIPCAFTGVPASVLRGEIDAGVWHIANSAVPLDLAGLRVEPLRRPASLAVWEKLSAGVLYGAPDRPELKAVLAALDLVDISNRQQVAIAETD